MTAIFPIILVSDSEGHSSPTFRKAFVAARTAQMDSWFCYDVVVRSRTEVTFIVFGMWNTVHGGKGNEKYRFDALVAPELTQRFIDQKILTIAEDRRAEELHAAEQIIIERYAAEIRAEWERSL